MYVNTALLAEDHAHSQWPCLRCPGVCPISGYDALKFSVTSPRRSGWLMVLRIDHINLDEF